MSNSPITTTALNSLQQTTSTNPELYKYLKKSFENEDISIFFKGFYNFFYDRGYEYDINGYSLIFFYPAHLSGAGAGGVDSSWAALPDAILHDYFKDFITFAVEFTPIDISVEKTSIGLIGNETFDYPTHVHSSGEVSLTYLDSDDLKLYTYHSIWVRYIHGVILGHLTPLEEYVETNLIDYMGSFYCIRFDADMKTPVSISKALGVYPTGLPYKEMLGVRGQHQVTLYNCSYMCSYFYEEPILNAGGNQALYNEFMGKFGKLFES